LRSSQEGRDEVDEVESWQGSDVSEFEDIEEGTKKRKRKGEALPFPTVEEINKGFIWGQDCMFNVPIDRVHPAKDPETNHRVLNIRRAKETFNRLLGDFWNDVSHMTLCPMGHVMELRQEDGTMKLSVRHFQRFHEHEDFKAAFHNHQEEGNPLSRTDFLTTLYCGSLWMDNISSTLVKYWLGRHSKEETLLKKSIESGSARGRLGLWCTTSLIFILAHLFKSMNYISNKHIIQPCWRI
jgi:hypothetical protein